MASSIIGSSMAIDGDITGDEDLVIQGTVRGRIGSGRTLIIEAGAVVEAEVKAKVIEIAGHVIGNVQATERVELKSSACVVGDIRAPRINIAEGASFKGNVDMQGNP
ncbi:MAG: polymer-forming cytoskeletal protein [Deltaproteobacteria bacterium]|jgi:cytoskeletal protein CcmA (bactofilin family)|nr:polymer-forming cytoskeletal protein [Deltaproteobacteria bacterium]